MSKIQPKNVKETLVDEFWIEAMQEELNQFKRSEVWDLVPRPEGVNVIGTKWIFKNKSDEHGIVTRNKERLVAQGYTQIEGLDFDETFAPVARLESIRLLLGVSCILKFKLFQMDVKSAFLNGYLNEEVYVEQPKEFIDPSWICAEGFGKEEWDILQMVCNELYGDQELAFEMMYSLIDVENNASGMNQRKGIIDEIEKVISRTFYQNEDDATNYYTDKMNRKKNYGGKYNEKFLEYGNQPPEEETDEEAE